MDIIGVFVFGMQDFVMVVKGSFTTIEHNTKFQAKRRHDGSIIEADLDKLVAVLRGAS